MPWLRSVVVDDFDDDDGRDLRPIQPAVVAKRARIRRLEDESTRVIEIDGQLSQALPFELMAPCRGQLGDVSKTSGCAEVVETPADYFAGPFPERPLTQLDVVADPPELLRLKPDVQLCTQAEITARVNVNKITLKVNDYFAVFRVTSVRP
jgi:hypothetical protein